MRLDWLNLFFGVVGCLGFCFSIFAYFRTQSAREIEAAKAAMRRERIRSVLESFASLLHSIDSIVQVPKRGDVTVEHLQDMARLARAQAVVMASMLRGQERDEQAWHYGRVVESVSVQQDLVKDEPVSAA